MKVIKVSLEELLDMLGKGELPTAQDPIGEQLCHCGTLEQALAIGRKELEATKMHGDCSTWQLTVGLAMAAVALIENAEVLKDSGMSARESARGSREMTDHLLYKLIEKQAAFLQSQEGK